MDDTRFDALARRCADPATRRGTLRLLAAGLLSALLAQHGGPLVRAQRKDSDQDGLFDDDEVNIYGTKPDVSDTDGDGFGDGQEICNRDRQDPNCQQDQIHTNPLVNEDAAGPPPPPPPPPPPAAPTCIALGGACAQYSDCCPVVEHLLCCIDANGVGTCTDVAADGSFLCPDPGVPATGCPVGQTNCGGFCTDLSTDHGNCGMCGQRCSQVGPDYNCVSGACTKVCFPTTLTNCGNICTDLLIDDRHCGACGNACGCVEDGCGTCRDGECWYPF